MTQYIHRYFRGGLVAISALLVVACSQEQQSQSAVQLPPPERLENLVAEGLDDAVLIQVNGKPITQYDYNLWQLAEGRSGVLNGDEGTKLMDRLVETEVMAQKARELGLDKDPAFIRSMALAQAKILMVQRQELERLLMEQESKAIAISDEQAQEYYNKHEKAIRQRYHLGSLQFPTEKEAKEVIKRIRKGESFEDVANEVVSSMPGMPPEDDPKALWDLGFVSWTQIPPDIMDVISKLKPGQLGGPIHHEKAGYVVLKLLEVEHVEEADFPSLRIPIIQRLRDQAVKEHLDAFRRELMANAKVEKVRDPKQLNLLPAPNVH